jgi:hypothetical protein
MAGRIQRLPSRPDDMSRMQDRDGKSSKSGFPQQISFYGGLLNAVVAKGSARRFFGGRDLDTRPMDPDGAAMEKMLDFAAQRFHQMARAFNGKADQINHHIGAQVTDLLPEFTRAFFF